MGCPEAVDALWVVALVSELAPVFPLLRHPRLRSHRLCTGTVGPHRVALLRAGVGPERAFRRTQQALSRVSPRTVWSLGSCGSLEDTLTIGTCVTASTLRGPRGAEYPALPVADLSDHRLLTVDRPIFTPQARHAARRTGATICEMEASGVARAVAGRWPVHVVKVVSDLAGGAPDPVIDAAKAVAMAHFHIRVERLMRAHIVPLLPYWLDKHLVEPAHTPQWMG